MKWEIKPSNVYENKHSVRVFLQQNPQIKIVGFRPPLKGETYLTTCGVSYTEETSFKIQPRFILEQYKPQLVDEVWE